MVKCFFGCFLLLIFPVFMMAQQLTLSDAIQTGLKNSLDIHLYKNEVNINEINNYIGIAGGLPIVTTTATDNESYNAVYQKLNTGQIINRSGATGNVLSANLNGSILLYNGFRVKATKERLNQLVKQSDDQLNSTIQNTMAGIITAYYDVVRQQNYIHTIDLSIDVASKKLDIIKTQQQVGLANNADLFQAQLDLNTLQQSRQSQILTVNQAKAELLRQLTLNADSVINISDTIIVDKSLKLDDVLANLITNGDIQSADEQILINEQIVRETAAQRYPTIRATGGYSFSNNQSSAGLTLINRVYGPVAGLSLNIPIYNGSIYKRQQRIAEINVNNAAIQRDILLRDYKANVVKTYQAYSTTLQQLETQQKNFDLSLQLLNLVLLRFQYRQATIIDLTQAQQSFSNAGYLLVNYSFAAKQAEIELKRVSNKLTP